ncbi:uncharacterized protein FA14DRAFT_160802 [Meira miltonrushii]|uniref:Response regulatory domain-containing protein n=1 Tax=Meira miltonrushii TaxID=1280837 RepID=A0A316VIG5_9BASI|nr:uncharacterized protein FA14DRAFT_160802 [Meira miltonrushii]PWN35801.1 hypothetical protein FA14DRAFT_160802 [Meira miltonrushii]
MEDKNKLQTPSTASSGSSSVNNRVAPSPLPADALDYFSETAARLGGNGGSTGVMIQSPDGRPAGIFFHPRTNSGLGTRTPGSAASSNGGKRRGSAEERFAAAINANRGGQRSSHASGSGSSGVSSPTKRSPKSSAGATIEGENVNVGGENANQAGQPSKSRNGSETGENNIPNNNTKEPSASVTRSMAGTISNKLPVNTSNGNIFSPQIELQSLLTKQKPPTATPLMSLGTAGEHTSSPQSLPVKGLTAAEKSQAASGSKIDTQNTNNVERQQVSTPPDASLPSSQGPSLLMSPSQQHGRPSFGNEAGQNARQTFTSNLPTAVARPSAQPQSGLLIGAGFSQSRARGNLGPKRTAASIEVLPPIKVLIVEDNPINVKILSTFLKQRKIKFGVARDGREAVNEWQTGGYHLILMDIQLPVMDGIEATKEIRKMEQQANIGSVSLATPGVSSASSSNRELSASNHSSNHASAGPASPSVMLQNSLRSSVIIVALTASVLNSDRVAALAAGCNDFLNKPVNLNWLERKVIEWGSMQYLIGFRDLPDSYYQRRNARLASSGDENARRNLLSPTGAESLRSQGLVDRGFGSGPNQMARELANRLYIGKKARPTATAGNGA